MKTLLIWDMDGVLVNLTETFVIKANELSGQPILNPHEGGETWRYEDYYSDEVIGKTFSDPDVWLKAKPFDDYLYLFNKNKSRSMICSSPANAISCACKYEWLQKHGVEKDKYIFAVNKTFLASVKGAVLIDDSASNCADFIRAGGRAIMVMRHYSKGFPKKDVELAMSNYVDSAYELNEVLKKL